jgi:hypothetical protein
VIFRYLQYTKDAGLLFGECAEGLSQVCGFVNSDYAKDLDKGRSITGYVFKVLNNLVS